MLVVVVVVGLPYIALYFLPIYKSVHLPPLLYFFHVNFSFDELKQQSIAG